jgi:cyclic beta-1,2-glucan synthetase
LELKNGIPVELKSIVVIPTLLTGSDEIEELISRMEIHYLANSEDHLEFALLTDFIDADTPTSPNDERLLQEARQKIAYLNRKYPRSTTPRFHLFHRKRQWNPSEQKWIGWERKRGKLEEFNRLLLGLDHTSFEPDPVPQNIRFVITLDSDTILPRETARKMIGILAHPLMQPVLDENTNKTIHGYGILQPRVSHTLSSANTSLFARSFSGPAGMDPYTRAVSDVYQDLFGEASFIGKGIYDLQAFHTTVSARFPENTLLSHDLVEGAFARTGLVSDIELFDDHPSDYINYSIRQHRWIRGDWQAVHWLLQTFLHRRNDAPSALNAWKLIDNIRRSLVTPFLLILFLVGWLALPGTPLYWTVFTIVALTAPIFIPLTSLFVGTFQGIKLRDHLRNVFYSFKTATSQAILTITFLPHDAFLHIDAIVRTLYRLMRRKKLLEWTTAAQAERSRNKTLGAYHSRMWHSLLLTLSAMILIAFERQHAWTPAAALLIFWSFAPTLAWLTGLKIQIRVKEISTKTEYELRSHASECWRYFATFVNEENHWLPCDNFQQDPVSVIAHRTSPTNIGFALLANICGFDLGYIGVKDFVHRTEKTLATVSRLSTFNGHLFNWYDTVALQPLEPRYVSTVDSGNLAGALLTLRQFVLADEDLFRPPLKRFEGIADDLTGFLRAAHHHKSSFANIMAEVRIIRREVRRFLKQDAPGVSEEDLLIWLQKVLSHITAESPEEPECKYWLDSAERTVASHLSDYERPQDLKQRLLSIARECETLVQEMDFRFLYDEDRGLFSIGFNVTNGRLDSSYYDLFASESRLTSFVAISKGDIPQSHWFRMGRTMTKSPNRMLVSWSGSMFEYLMPLLLIRNEAGTLWDYNYRKVVQVQQEYAKRKRVPWGISESAYNRRDVALNYQYGPFGVPWIGLKRNLESDLVIAPYASFLAAMVNPDAALKNLHKLEKLGVRGRFGFFEAVDFTPERIPEGARYEVIQTFMAHHLGMSLVSLNNIIHDRIMQKRFHANPAIQAIDLLVQERMPVTAGMARTRTIDERPQLFGSQETVVAREFTTPFLYPPRTQILSNGKYTVFISTSGSGYSEWNGIRINRWNEDPTLDRYGTYFYLKDRQTNTVWSAGFQPVRKLPESYTVNFSEDRVEFRRRDGVIETHYDTIVSPDENAEIRRLTIVNTSNTVREIEVTSYSEIILTTAAKDYAHRTFSNLFVETEYLPEIGALLARRSGDSRSKNDLWTAQISVLEKETGDQTIQFETDRSRFLGRNRSVTDPFALESDTPLSGNEGAVLDPIFSLRRVITIPPYSREAIAFVLLVAESREEAISLIERYSEYRKIVRTFELASAHADVLLRQLSVSRDSADLYQRLAGRIIFSNRSMRPRPVVLERNNKTQADLWQFGISGDLPICLVRVEESNDLPIVNQILKAHEYWRRKGLLVDLVILNEFPTSYFQNLQQEIYAEIRSTSAHDLLNHPGGIFVLSLDHVQEEDRLLLRSVARIEIHAQRGSLASQLLHPDDKDTLPSVFAPRTMYLMEDSPVHIHQPDILLSNGYGGFTEPGEEYRIRLDRKETTPAPWINVISNPEFGFQISESGSGMTWSINSHENRLTPFFNDPVTDPADCVLYLRDEESGNFWSVTPRPVPGNGKYEVTHGNGYTIFQNGSFGLEQTLTAFVPIQGPVKILKLHIRNHTRRTREISATFYAEMILGNDRSRTAHHLTSSVEGRTGALLIRNPYNSEFGGRVAFLWINDINRTLTGDRTEFLGACGSLEDPAALHRNHLSGRTGPGFDPCAAIQSKIHLRPYSDHTFLILMGQAADTHEVRTLLNQYGKYPSVEKAFVQVEQFWEDTLDTIRVKTPDPTFDLLMNRWLLYQAISCRFWARSALYQSGGAYGFRDQLQDAMAFVYSHPEYTKKHLLKAASRQFIEGDVQHWWHPPAGKGVRTRISDDLLWLPYCTAFYCKTTGDYEILEQRVPYLVGPLLKSAESEEYFEPQVSDEDGTLFEHCLRAIDHSLLSNASHAGSYKSAAIGSISELHFHNSLNFGPHGLPLIGSGDWNDGFNRVGIEGRGESVWLAWFLVKILQDFSELSELQNDLNRAQHYRDIRTTLIKNIHAEAWDGAWFARCFHDDGTVMGSADRPEGQIDSIAQSWGILSEASDLKKIQQALEAVESRLLTNEDQLALLFHPPYGSTDFDPGYVRDYPQGIRENGGQYNHAVAWLIAAYCSIGEADKAYDCFRRMNPILRSQDVASAWKYKLEPYAVAADIYAHPNHRGRGGWSWYTGSAAWLYRAGLEYVLGLQLNGDSFHIEPMIPSHWPEYQMTFRHDGKIYEINVKNRDGDVTIMVNGMKVSPAEKIFFDRQTITEAL